MMKQLRVLSITVLCLALTLSAGMILTACDGGSDDVAGPTKEPEPPPPGQYALLVICTPSNGGTVAKSPDQSSYAPGTKVRLTASPASGFQFVRWEDEGGAKSSLNPIDINMVGNKALTAVFAQAYTLSILSPSSGDSIMWDKAFSISWEASDNLDTFEIFAYIPMDNAWKPIGITSAHSWNFDWNAFKTAGADEYRRDYQFRVHGLDNGVIVISATAENINTVCGGDVGHCTDCH